MYSSVLVIFAIAAAAVQANADDCSTVLSVDEFKALYCGASLVFRGGKNYASSSLGNSASGYMVYGYTVFQADQVYKGSPADNNDIEINRIWRQSVDECDSASFPDQASTFLVFATGTTEYTVETCRHSFPWDNCVPDAVKTGLSTWTC